MDNRDHAATRTVRVTVCPVAAAAAALHMSAASAVRLSGTATTVLLT